MTSILKVDSIQNAAGASEIKIDTIKNATGTAAMTIDSGGRIFTPARPAFRAYRSINSNLTAGTAVTALFDTEDFDLGSNYNHSASVFTAPVSGLYSFSVNLSYYLNGDSRQIEGRLRVNGTVVQTADSFIQRTSSNNTHTTISITTLLNLTANDEVDVQHLTVTTVGYYHLAKRSVFSGYLIG